MAAFGGTHFGTPPTHGRFTPERTLTRVDFPAPLWPTSEHLAHEDVQVDIGECGDGAEGWLEGPCLC